MDSAERERDRRKNKKERKGREEEEMKEEEGGERQAGENSRERDLQMIEPVRRGFISLHQYNQHNSVFPHQNSHITRGSLFCVCL